MDLFTYIKQHEGLRLKPYTDTTGHITIGYGTNISEISEAEAHSLFSLRLMKITEELYKKLPWIKNLSNQRQMALIDMSYNMGVPKLLQFHDMLESIHAGKFEQAAKDMLNSRYAKQVPSRANSNAKLIREG